VFWHTPRYTIGMGTNGAPMVETNLETVRNPRIYSWKDVSLSSKNFELGMLIELLTRV